MELDIPPQLQLFVALIIGVLVAIGAVYKFFSDLRQDPAGAASADQLRILGAALGDTAAMDRVTAALDRIARESRDNGDKIELVAKSVAGMATALERVASAVTDKPTPPRRR